MAQIQKILTNDFVQNASNEWISPDAVGDQRRDLRSGGKYIFNDTDNRVVHDSAVGTNQKFTYLVKAKITDSGILICGWGSGSATLYVTTSSIRCSNGTTNTDPNTLTGLTLDDDFHRIAAKADWTSTPYAQRIWIDGVEQTFDSTVGVAASVGGRQVGGRNGGLYFGGEIAEYAAYEDLLSDEEIEAWSAGGDPPAAKTANDVICHCDEGSGTTAYDVSENANHGTIYGTLTSFHDTDISLRSWHNEVGYNLSGSTYVPRLETAANQALDPASQTDVLGSTLTYYGRAKYDGLLKSSCLSPNGTDNVITFSDLSGVTISDQSGTSTASINGNDIEMTAGDLYYLLLSDGTELLFGEQDGATVYDASGGGNHGTLGGSLTSIWTTSEFQEPYNNKRGFDRWENDSTGEDLYVPLQSDGTSIKGTGDTITGYTWQEKVSGSDKYHNGSEMEISQPENCPQLYDIDQNEFTTSIWYNAAGTPQATTYSDYVTNYESENIWITGDYALTTGWIVYGEATTDNIYVAEDSDWNTAGNWLQGTVPGNSDTAIFDAVSGDCTFDADQVIGTLQTTSDYTGVVTVPSSYSLTPATLTLADSGDLIGAGTLVLQDWTASLPSWTGSLTLEATGSAGDVTITPTGTLDLINLTLTASGDDDLIIDNSNDPTYQISGNWTSTETSTGEVRWSNNGESVILDGSGSQTLDVSFDFFPDNRVNSIQNSNTDEAVTVNSDIYVLSRTIDSGASYTGSGSLIIIAGLVGAPEALHAFVPGPEALHAFVPGPEKTYAFS